MGAIAIALTKKQHRLMSHLFEKTGSRIGMILGQFFDDTDGTAFFVAEFVDMEKGVKIQKVMGVDPGSIVTPICKVHK